MQIRRDLSGPSSALWVRRECTRYCVRSQALQLAVFNAEVAVSRSPFFQHRCGTFSFTRLKTEIPETRAKSIDKFRSNKGTGVYTTS
jgi:hypothetical protein